MIKNVYWSSCTVPVILVLTYSTSYTCQILMILEYSRQIFEKHSNINFQKNPPNGSRVVPCGHKETDRHDGANSRLPQFLRQATVTSRIREQSPHIFLPSQHDS